MDMWVAFLLAIVNNAAVNKGYTYLLESALNSLGYMSKSGNAGLCFFPKGNFLRNCCAFFFTAATTFTFPLTVQRDSNFSTASPTLVIFFFCL